jgi:hypothetical protein
MMVVMVMMVVAMVTMVDDGVGDGDDGS